MIHTSEQINELATALAKAQAAIENVDALGKNPAFKREGKESKYAKLSDALDEVRPKLAAQGISVVQMAVNGEANNIGVATRLLHSSGQWIESTLYVAPQQFTAQGAGSVITYLRRYCLMAMTGIAPEDDDGNAASVAAPQPQAPRAGMVRAADVPPSGAVNAGTAQASGNGTRAQTERGQASSTATPGPTATTPASRSNGNDDMTMSVQQRATIFREEMTARFAKCKMPTDVDTIIHNNGKALEGLKKMAPEVYAEVMQLSTNAKNALYGETG